MMADHNDFHARQRHQPDLVAIITDSQRHAIESACAATTLTPLKCAGKYRLSLPSAAGYQLT
jgi:hypothetical protein